MKIFDYVETLGANKFTHTHLIKLKRKCGKACEYGRAVKSVRLNWTAGIAHGLVKCRAEGGLHVRRKLYNKYSCFFFASAMQHILIREFVSFKPVGETDIDQSLFDVERICDLYIKVGLEEDHNLNKGVNTCDATFARQGF